MQTDAALTIARWAWPERRTWRAVETQAFPHARAEAELLVHRCGECGMPKPWNIERTRFSIDEPEDVHVAELVVIDRVGREVHGRALLHELLLERYTWSEGETASLCATAPLDSRVRALLEVIRAQE